ncbi:TetR/AcrR family transcriptional regulator [Streptomyces luteolifulvus]|uniref:TetR/AcrR family transcriptional regulator n=1 Tax=Streptomyces luteolifulvus TaxID=2615112 RepID=A0A6H9UWS6_9ACTN|nr:TetR/AcrR family transcriptional regulator [Streptomyces luteolifulvus]KAB1143291.1 TetR/AcrR family transcriptional regulator [Streptomyces luteolifulvus]
MPKLWNETIEQHRRAVRDAVVEVTAALVAEHGLRGVTMSRIAEGTGIGRATLYKYFPDVESIMSAWHERQIAGHLQELAALRDRPGSAGERLTAVLDAYALIQQRRHGHDPEISAVLHRGDHVDRAERHLLRFVGELLAEGVEAGEVRDDVSPDELAGYCLHALAAAGGLKSRAAVRRLVRVTVDGLRPERGPVRQITSQGRRGI